MTATVKHSMTTKKLAYLGHLMWSLHPLSLLGKIPAIRNMVTSNDEKAAQTAEASARTTVEVSAFMYCMLQMKD